MIAQRIRDRRTTLRMTQAKLGLKLGIGKSTISEWEHEKRTPSIDILREIADVLETTPAYLMGWTDDPEDYSNAEELNNLPAEWAGRFDDETAVKAYRAMHEEAYHAAERSDMADEPISPLVLRIPILGSVPAGVPIEAIEDVLDWEEIPISMLSGGREYFGLQVKGNSMTPQYQSGDTLIVRRQATCDSGDDCIIMVNGNDATFKRIRFAGDAMTLQPLNPEYEPRTFTQEDVRELPVMILGVVVEIRRKIK